MVILPDKTSNSEQRSANLFCEGPDNEHIVLCELRQNQGHWINFVLMKLKIVMYNSSLSTIEFGVCVGGNTPFCLIGV